MKSFSATACYPEELSDSTQVQWDFDYDGETFNADPSAGGTLTPTYTFLDPGTYDVALQAVDNDGSSNIDVISVTVTDMAPTGTVALAGTQPDGSAQTLQAGAPVWFSVTGLDYTDPSITPSVWVDWDGSGNFDLVTSDQWQNDVTAASGAQSFLFSHVFADPGSYSPSFHFEDAEGDFTPQTLSVPVGDAGPSGTFGWGVPKRPKRGRILRQESLGKGEVM